MSESLSLSDWRDLGTVFPALVRLKERALNSLKQEQKGPALELIRRWGYLVLSMHRADIQAASQVDSLRQRVGYVRFEFSCLIREYELGDLPLLEWNKIAKIRLQCRDFSQELLDLLGDTETELRNLVEAAATEFFAKQVNHNKLQSQVITWRMLLEDTTERVREICELHSIPMPNLSSFEE